MSYQKSAYESRINIHISELLSQHNVISRAEIINSGRRDVVVYHQGLVCVIEGSYSKSDAEKDAEKRIEQLNADIDLGRIPRQYEPNFCQNRKNLDSAFLDALGIPVHDDYLMNLYENIYGALRQWLG